MVIIGPGADFCEIKSEQSVGSTGSIGKGKLQLESLRDLVCW